MTGRGGGFCAIRLDDVEPEAIRGFAGAEGRPVSVEGDIRKEAEMPAGDGTGPMGMGPMTGRAAGFCAGYAMPGYVNPMMGRGCGMGFGRGGGRGRRNQFYATGMTGWQRAAAGWPLMAGVPAPTREQQLNALKGQAEQLEGSLGELRKRMAELEAEKTGKA